MGWHLETKRWTAHIAYNPDADVRPYSFKTWHTGSPKSVELTGESKTLYMAKSTIEQWLQKRERDWSVYVGYGIWIGGYAI